MHILHVRSTYTSKLYLRYAALGTFEVVHEPALAAREAFLAALHARPCLLQALVAPESGMYTRDSHHDREQKFRKQFVPTDLWRLPTTAAVSSLCSAHSKQ